MFVVWGNHYFARRNLYSEIGRCATCRRLTRLTSFDTFKMFHLYWVPLIPLGRKRVLARCGSCQSDRELPLARWEEQKAQALETVSGHFEREPTRLEYAVEALTIFAAFGDSTRAAETAAHLEQFFPEAPVAKAALATWYVSQGDAARASALVNQVGATAGEGPAGDEVLRGVAEAALATGNLEIAKEQLLRMQQPAGRDLWNLLNLAAALLKGKKHAEAYEVYAFTFRHFPSESARNTIAVKNVRALEAKLNARPTIVPASASSNRDAFIGLGIVGAAALLAAVANFVLGQFQDLYLLNETRTAATVWIDGEQVRLLPHTRVARSISEGTHTVKVRLENGVTRERTIAIENSLLERATLKNAFVYDVLGASVLSHEDVVYGRETKRGRAEVLAGHEFYSFHDVDFPFQKPPSSIQTESGSAVRVALARVDVTPPQLLSAVLRKDKFLKQVDARTYAEGHLRGGDTDEELVGRYMLVCQENCEAEASALVKELGIATSAVDL